MENTICERIKMIRKSKNMNQAEFSKFLGMGHSTLGMLEVGKRAILDRHIKTICSLCNVNEDWLRNGTGEMYSKSKKGILAEISKEYNLDSLDEKILMSYLNLDAEKRKIMKEHLRNLVDAISSNPENSQPGPITVEQAEEEYIKSLSASAKKTTSSVSNITTDDKEIAQNN